MTEDEARILEEYFWGGGEEHRKSQAAQLYANSADIIDWKNPPPVPEHLKPEPPKPMRYWLENGT